MDRAKQAIHDIKSKAGHHDTTVHERVAPAVQHETIKPTQHEEVQTAVEQEIHQDHYHRTVQPVKDTQVLPEQHKHRVAGTEHREFDHRNQRETEQALRAEAAKLHDERVVTETTHTQSRAPTVKGEHFHHHVHETIQPVIQKEVIQPEVIHTTVPVHEVHHYAASHHPTSTLPAVSMDEFKRKGGKLGGAERHVHEFEGCPETAGGHTHQEGGNRNLNAAGTAGTVGTAGTARTAGTAGTTGATRTAGTAGAAGAAGIAATTAATRASGRARSSSSSSASSLSDTERRSGAGLEKKPSLVDKLNPFASSK